MSKYYYYWITLWGAVALALGVWGPGALRVAVVAVVDIVEYTIYTI